MDSNTLKILLFIPVLYTYISLTRIHKGKTKNIIFSLLILSLFIISYFTNAILLYGFCFIFILLFTLFYDEEPFKLEVLWLVPYLIITTLVSFIIKIDIAIVLISLISLLLIYYKKKQRDLVIILLSTCLFILLVFLIKVSIFKLIFSFLLLVILDVMHSNSESTIETNINKFQKQILTSQYKEVKDIYLQMRGWRHDYHSHLQSMKAHLESNNINKLKEYLNELEDSLNSVDLLVKSGNEMIDAILNSKLTLAKKDNININVKVSVIGSISITDTDLCIILGNLLDNAIESCKKINEKDRFIRVYLDTFGSQFYLSIQNSAKEILNFEEKNYISTKRGNHGLGMKRVALLVENYNGYLNLQNEPGIFATELTIPLS